MAQEAAVKQNKKIFTTKEMVLTAMMSALMAVCSWIEIPGTVPFTLQTFAVFFALMLLGGKNGFFATLVYILLGAVGLPVFSGFSGGISALTSYSGGYIVGFLFMAGAFWAAEFLPWKNIFIRVAALIIGLALCYAFGTAWFMHVTQSGIKYSLSACVVPFIPFDLAKMALAVVLAERIKKHITL